MSLFLLIVLVLSIFCSMFTGTASALSGALLDGAKQAVTLTLTLAGPICLWSGLSHTMAQTGLTEQLSRLLQPLLKRLFPNAWEDKTARHALCGNLSANLLGLGNAATPLGVQAACTMAKDGSGRASDELCKLIVMNTASVQLIPATVAAVRAGLGAASPFDILPAVWLTSLCSVSAGLFMAKVLSKWVR